MDGQNPHLAAQTRLPTRPYTLTIIDRQKRSHVIPVDPAKLPSAGHGLPASILDIALTRGVDLEHACGGQCACSTCHVIVLEGIEACGQPGEEEEDRLDQAYGLTTRSRLACRCVPDGSRDVVVEIPAWNRNLACEARQT